VRKRLRVGDLAPAQQAVHLHKFRERQRTTVASFLFTQDFVDGFDESGGATVQAPTPQRAQDSARAPDARSEIDARSVAFTYEKWLSRHVGANAKLEVSHAYILNEKGRRVRGFQTELGGFISF